jgi:hypothetical protein
MIFAFYLKQRETIALRRVMGVDIGPTADHDQKKNVEGTSDGQT